MMVTLMLTAIPTPMSIRIPMLITIVMHPLILIPVRLLPMWIIMFSLYMQVIWMFKTLMGLRRNLRTPRLITILIMAIVTTVIKRHLKSRRKSMIVELQPIIIPLLHMELIEGVRPGLQVLLGYRLQLRTQLTRVVIIQREQLY